MCAAGRKVLIQGEAKKNKSHRKKYFVLNCCTSYTEPRLHYFSSLDKWNQYQYDICQNDDPDSVSFRFIDLSNLFYVDNVHRTKPKHGGLDLYMEDRHMTLTFPTDEQKNLWKEIFENVVYKNGKINSYPKIEHTLQAGLRFKSKDNIDKAQLLQLKGDFRVCFMKTSLIFVSKSLANPEFVMQYQFIRKLESRFDGTFRLEIGRAAPVGECNLIMQLSDYTESNAAHTMLINCTKSFKIPLPEPVRLRSSVSRFSDRTNSLSCSRQMSLVNSTCGPLRSESCVEHLGKFESKPRTVDNSQDSDDNSYMVMNTTVCEVDDVNRSSSQDYFEHISRIYKCSHCAYFTKVILFCSRCQTESSIDERSMRTFTKTAVPLKSVPSIRDKAHSLTERPFSHSVSLHSTKHRNYFPQLQKSIISQTSQSSSKTSTNEMSSNSKMQSQISLSVCSNRRDDEIFADVDFDNWDCQVLPTYSSSVSSDGSLKCRNCCRRLVNVTSASELSSSMNHRCAKCGSDMMTLTMLVGESEPRHVSDWIPRTMSLIGQDSRSSQCKTEYVDTQSNNDTVDLDFHYIKT